MKSKTLFALLLLFLAVIFSVLNNYVSFRLNTEEPAFLLLALVFGLAFVVVVIFDLEAFKGKVAGWKIVAAAAMFLALVFGIWFYWWQWRPSQIIQKCGLEAKDKATKKFEAEGGAAGEFRLSDRDQYYKWCLQEKGLKK